MFVGDLPAFDMHIINKRADTHIIVDDWIPGYSDLKFDE